MLLMLVGMLVLSLLYENYSLVSLRVQNVQSVDIAGLMLFSGLRLIEAVAIK